jgi:quercetin dioxygenase-like cupin family protein
MPRKASMVPVAVEAFVEFRDEDFYASKIFDSEHMRIVAFCFKPGQVMEDVRVKPSVLLYASSGEGFFSVGRKEHPVKPGQFVVVAPNEAHGVRAGKRENFVALVVIAPSPTGLLE